MPALYFDQEVMRLWHKEKWCLQSYKHLAQIIIFSIYLIHWLTSQRHYLYGISLMGERMEKNMQEIEKSVKDKMSMYSGTW